MLKIKGYKAWIYCISKEINSCNELGKLRADCIRFGKERRMNISGSSSLNISGGNYLLASTLREAIKHKVNVLIIGNLNILPNYKKCYLLDVCKAHDITIIKYVNKK